MKVRRWWTSARPLPWCPSGSAGWPNPLRAGRRQCHAAARFHHALQEFSDRATTADRAGDIVEDVQIGIVDGVLDELVQFLVVPLAGYVAAGPTRIVGDGRHPAWPKDSEGRGRFGQGHPAQGQVQRCLRRIRAGRERGIQQGTDVPRQQLLVAGQGALAFDREVALRQCGAPTKRAQDRRVQAVGGQQRCLNRQAAALKRGIGGDVQVHRDAVRPGGLPGRDGPHRHGPAGQRASE